jgi:NADH-quinone oxidoreductase subunit N
MNQFPDLTPVIPEILMVSLALLILMLDLFIKRKEVLAFLSIIFTVAVTVVVASTYSSSMGVTFGGMFVSDGYGMFFKLIFSVTLVLSMLISIRYLAIVRVNFGEYYSLMLLATVGMMIMASAGDLISLYVGLELMAMSTYVLAGFIRYERRSNEASLKYFLLGAFASALLLYGMSLTYGLTGTTDIKGIAAYIADVGFAGNKPLMLAILMFAAAFGFKIAAVPFHMWAPDVYEGAPTSVTAFMSVGPKAAGFAALGRVFLIAFGSLQVDWAQVLIPVAILTMAVGNVVAISQSNIKRMLAYSSIAHAGYILLGIIAGTPEGTASMMNYLLIYAFMNIGAFAVVILLKSEGLEGEELSDYKGLSKAHPLCAALMLIFMFSLTGIPPTAGFMGKFYLFMAAVNAGYMWLVVVAVVFSAISAYFYLRVVIYMYMVEPEQKVSLSTSPSINLAVALTALAVLVIGVIPGKVLDLAKWAVVGFGG